MSVDRNLKYTVINIWNIWEGRSLYEFIPTWLRIMAFNYCFHLNN